MIGWELKGKRKTHCWNLHFDTAFSIQFYNPHLEWKLKILIDLVHFILSFLVCSCFSVLFLFSWAKRKWMRQHLKSWFAKENVCTRNLHPLLNCVNKLLIFESGLSYQSAFRNLDWFPWSFSLKPSEAISGVYKRKENVLLQVALVMSNCISSCYRKIVCKAFLCPASFSLFVPLNKHSDTANAPVGA